MSKGQTFLNKSLTAVVATAVVIAVAVAVAYTELLILLRCLFLKILIHRKQPIYTQRE